MRERIIFNRSSTGQTGQKYLRYIKYQQDFQPRIDDIGLFARRVSYTSDIALDIAMKAKRVFDILFAFLALIFLSPLILVSAVLIKLESEGPVFYKQQRIGLNRRRRNRRSRNIEVSHDRRDKRDRRKNIMPGKPFCIYKLRTMRNDAENNGPSLAQSNDPRITRIGSLLRKTRVDEIPQFINVIRGDMSIVGPRPERTFYINRIKHEVPEFPLRLKVKPGITGLAQVESGYTQNLSEMREKLLYDLKYISELSLFQEIKILVMTIYVVISGKGAC